MKKILNLGIFAAIGLVVTIATVILSAKVDSVLHPPYRYDDSVPLLERLPTELGSGAVNYGLPVPFYTDESAGGTFEAIFRCSLRPNIVWELISGTYNTSFCSYIGWRNVLPLLVDIAFWALAAKWLIRFIRRKTSKDLATP